MKITIFIPYLSEVIQSMRNRNIYLKYFVAADKQWKDLCLKLVGLAFKSDATRKSGFASNEVISVLL